MIARHQRVQTAAIAPSAGSRRRLGGGAFPVVAVDRRAMVQPVAAVYDRRAFPSVVAVAGPCDGSAFPFRHPELVEGSAPERLSQLTTNHRVTPEVAAAVPSDGSAFPFRHPELVEGSAPERLSQLTTNHRVTPEVAAAVPSGGTPKEKCTAAGDSGGYLKLFFAILLLALAFPSRADITGTVTLTGQPASKDETFVAPVAGCGESPIRHTENWKVGTKGELADVVVWIVDPKFKSEAPPAVVTEPTLPPPEISVKQLGCRYIPHVIAVQAGVPFKIINADPTIHNIRAKVCDGPGKPPGEDVFNFGQPRQGQADDKQFDDPGLYTLQCDVHPWMQCWVMALKSSCFGVSDLDGVFKLRSIDALPLVDGDYKIDAWHPRFAQTLEQTIHVKNGTGTVNFQFDGAKSF